MTVALSRTRQVKKIKEGYFIVANLDYIETYAKNKIR